MNAALDVDPRDAELARMMLLACELEPGRGMWADVDELTYHELDYTSRGDLEILRRSPAEFHGRRIARTIPHKDSKALRVGRLWHAATFEPERWSTFAVPPDCDRRTKEGKAIYAAWRAENPNAIVVDADEHDLARVMAEAVAEHPLASQLCSGCSGASERTIIWRDADTGILMRARIDRSLERPIAVDGKSFGRTPNPEAFMREVLAHWYYGQAAVYLDGLFAVTGIEHRFVFVVVHKEPPHEVLVCELGPAEIEMGRREYRAALRELAWRREKNDWRATWERAPQLIEFPGWAFRSSDDWRNDDVE